MDELKKVLLVEGVDDAHVFRNLLYEGNFHLLKLISTNWLSTINWSEEKIGVVYQNGKGASGREALLDNLEEGLEKGTILTLGVVVDKDEDRGIWDAVINRITEKFPLNTHLPPSPIEGGLITIVHREPRPDLKLGIWLMPNNQDEGGLESFFAELIDDPLLWPKAQETLDEVFVLGNNSFRFPSTHRKKAEVATWLAWQKKVNRRLGETIRSGRYLNLNHPSAQSFVDWVQRLFSPEN